MKRGRYWTFALVDPTGGSLLRMSTQNKPDGELWVAFFKQAGCTIEVRVVYPRPRLRSHAPAVAMRGGDVCVFVHRREQRPAVGCFSRVLVSSASCSGTKINVLVL